MMRYIGLVTTLVMFVINLTLHTVNSQLLTLARDQGTQIDATLIEAQKSLDLAKRWQTMSEKIAANWEQAYALCRANQIRAGIQ